ncbi:hypothetical protein M758_UG023500 [Ceratodon purpureus]|nr:hypothetical protein M758_UG023500 [Ceratodon purpureus]
MTTLGGVANSIAHDACGGDDNVMPEISRVTNPDGAPSLVASNIPCGGDAAEEDEDNGITARSRVVPLWMTGIKRRPWAYSKVIANGLPQKLSSDTEAVKEAGVILNQEMARQKKKPKRLTENASAQELLPRAGQDPVRVHKEVWILHPEHRGTAVAQGKCGAHYKMPKSKLPSNRPCEAGVQWVHVQSVFVPGVAPMFGSKQKHIRTLEDALTGLGDEGG